MKDAWTTSVQRARTDVAGVLGSLHDTKEPAMVEENDKPLAVVTGPEASEQVGEQEAARDWAAVDRIRERNKDKDPEAELPFITRVVDEVRQDRYERARRAAEDRR
jgi:hypothetical protein